MPLLAARTNNKFWKISLDFYKNSLVINNKCSYTFEHIPPAPANRRKPKRLHVQ